MIEREYPSFPTHTIALPNCSEVITLPNRFNRGLKGFITSYINWYSFVFDFTPFAGMINPSLNIYADLKGKRNNSFSVLAHIVRPDSVLSVPLPDT